MLTESSSDLKILPVLAQNPLVCSCHHKLVVQKSEGALNKALTGDGLAAQDIKEDRTGKPKGTAMQCPSQRKGFSNILEIRKRKILSFK